jgi:hypothetical protein
MTFDEVYDSIANDKEPVTGQDGLRVMQIIKAAKVVLRKTINL